MSPVVVITDQSRVVSAGLWQHMLLAASLHRPDQGQRWTHTTLAATPSPPSPPPALSEMQVVATSEMTAMTELTSPISGAESDHRK